MSRFILNFMSTKSSVISALLSADDFLSGEELAKICSVSRTAIWKAIKAIEKDGYKIEAVTNRGYKILSEPDKLDSESIQSYIKGENLKTDLKIFIYDEIDSTNSEAKRIAAGAGSFRDEKGNLTPAGKKIHPSLFASSYQTGGKGRLGRVFVSPRDTGVYFSLLYSPRFGIKNPALYTAAAAVSVARAISKIYSEECSIKWVNDILLNDKKISGILVEGISNFETGTIDAAVVGIGINIFDPKFTGEISKIAGSIEEAKAAKGEKFLSSQRNALVGEVTKNLLDFYDGFDNENESEKSATVEKMISEYKKRSMLIGKTVTVNPVAGSSFKNYKAKVTDITEEIKLVIETESGERKELNSGEVSLHSYDFV